MAREMPNFVEMQPLRLLATIIAEALDTQKFLISSQLDTKDASNLHDIPGATVEEAREVGQSVEHMFLEEYREYIVTLEYVITLIESKSTEELKRLFSYELKQREEVYAQLCHAIPEAEQDPRMVHSRDFLFEGEKLFLEFAIKLVELAEVRQKFLRENEAPG